MLTPVQEQKMALAAYPTENSSIKQLSSHQLDIIKKIIEIFAPIEKITRSISANLASISIVIPYLRIYHFDTSDQRKPQGYISHITLTTGQYQDLPQLQGDIN